MQLKMEVNYEFQEQLIDYAQQSTVCQG